MSSKFINNDLLTTYHPRTKYYQYTAFGQAFQFLILATVWIGIVFGAAAGGGLTFAWLLPYLLLKFGADLGLGAELVRQTAEVLAYLAPTVTVATIIPVNALFMVLCERKFLALLTMRTGPTDVGPNGFLQTLADALKLLFKEDTTPAKADFLLFTLAPALFFAPAMVVFMPLLSIASNNLGIFALTNLDIGLIFVIGLASLGTMSLVMEGWASNNKYSLIGGLRAASQAISYEIPMVLALIAIILMSGSMNLVEVSDAQAGGLLQWNIFGNGQILEITNLFASANPNNIATSQLVMSPLLLGIYSAAFVLLCMLLFVIFVTASTAEVNRIPFDIPEAESELVSGFNTECSGMKFALFFLAEYTNLFIASGVAAVLFLGGSHLPISLEAENALYSSLSHVAVNLPLLGNLGGLLADVNLVWVVTSLVFITKIYLMFLLAIWIRATLPRLRQDQLMEFGWKYLIPLTLGIIFVMTILLEVLGR
jgi:NADH-quinone oxidoreductase subunit H